MGSFQGKGPLSSTYGSNAMENAPPVWNPSTHCHVHNNRPLYSVLIKTNLFHILTLYFSGHAIA
jgi:hypothetical protein